MRAIILAAGMALALSAAQSFAGTTGNGWTQSAPAGATTPAGPYTLDAKGKCHAVGGQFAKQGLCKPAPKRCRDPKTGRFVKVRGRRLRPRLKPGPGATDQSLTF